MMNRGHPSYTRTRLHHHQSVEQRPKYRFLGPYTTVRSMLIPAPYPRPVAAFQNTHDDACDPAIAIANRFIHSEKNYLINREKDFPVRTEDCARKVG